MSITRTKIYNMLAICAVICAAAALVIFPKQSVEAAGEGLKLCANVIIPSLFPFFVISTMTVELGLAGKLGRLTEGIMRRLFNVSGACSSAFILGFIGGYPVGAKTAISLYERGECTRAEAERLLSFCNNSGPAFILGVVGASVFSSSRVGLLLYAAHTIASIITGIMFRSWRGSKKENRRRAVLPQSAKPTVGFASAFTSAVKSSFSSTLNICGFVIFFTVFIRLLFLAGILPALANAIGFLLSPIGVDAETAQRLLTGVIELSSGVWSLNGAASSLSASAAMAAFMLGWAGISIHCQTLSFLNDSGLSAKTYIAGKFIQGVLSAGIVWLIFRLFPFEKAAAAYLAGQVSQIAVADFLSTLTASLLSAALISALIIIFASFGLKKSGKKKKDSV